MVMNLTLKDMLGIFAFTVGPLGTLMLLMWHHFNGSIHRVDEKLSGKIDKVDEKLSGKIDGVRDRVSRIEGLLAFAKIMPAEEIKPKEEVTDQKEVFKDTKGATVSHTQKLQQESRQEGIH